MYSLFDFVWSRMLGVLKIVCGLALLLKYNICCCISRPFTALNLPKATRVLDTCTNSAILYVIMQKIEGSGGSNCFLSRLLGISDYNPAPSAMFEWYINSEIGKHHWW